MEREERSLVLELTSLQQKYTDAYCNSLSKEDAEQAFRDLLTPFKSLYFSDHIIQYFELICRIASRIFTYSKFLISSLEQFLNSSENLEDKLFYLDLILQLKTKLNVSAGLSNAAKNYIDSITNPDSVERIINSLPHKRDREGELMASDLDSIYLSLIEFLICLSVKILDYHSETEIQIYCKDLNKILEFLQNSSLGDQNKMKKVYAKYISCINLILLNYSKDDIPSLYDSYLVRKMNTAILGYSQDPEVLYEWVKFIYKTIILEESTKNLKYLPESLLTPVISPSSWIKNTFLKLFDHCNVQYFKSFLSSSLSSDHSDMKFIGDVCLKGVMKFNSLSNTDIIQILNTLPTLLDLSPYDILPDYCFELLTLCYKRSLDHKSIQDLAKIVNTRLSSDLRLMSVNSLFRAGDYLALAPNQIEIKDKAKILVEIMIKPEILESADSKDRLYPLYVVLFAIAYIPDTPSNIENLKIELQNLHSRINNLHSTYGDRGALGLVCVTSKLMGLVKKANEQLGLIQLRDDQEFDLCKELLRNFSRLLQQIITKLTTSSPNSYKTQYAENENDILRQQYDKFKSDFNIETEIIPNDILQAQVPSSPISSESKFIDTNQTFTPQSVLSILSTTLLWNGMIGILNCVTTYSKSTKQADKNSILEKLHDWSSRLISIADSNLFRYLSSDISEPSKAYIIHQIFQCATDQEVTFSKLMSSAIRILLFQPTLAILTDPTLNYVLETKMIEIIKNIVNPDLGEYPFDSLINRVFYAPLDPVLDGQTIIGGYIFLNNKYMHKDPLSQAFAKITFIHELGHLLLRLQDSKYNFIKDTAHFQPSVRDLSIPNQTFEVGDFLETELFGFPLYYLNDSTINFLNNDMVWMYRLKKFKLEFKECIEKKEEKILLNRFRHRGMYLIVRTKKCVIRPHNFQIEEHKISP